MSTVFQNAVKCTRRMACFRVHFAKPHAPYADFPTRRLIVLDVDDVAVLDDVVLRLLAHQAGSLDLAFSAEPDDIGDGHRFGPDEAAGQVRMDAGSGIEGGAALVDEPGTHFLLAGSEEQHLPGRVHDPPQ